MEDTKSKKTKPENFDPDTMLDPFSTNNDIPKAVAKKLLDSVDKVHKATFNLDPNGWCKMQVPSVGILRRRVFNYMNAYCDPSHDGRHVLRVESNIQKLIAGDESKFENEMFSLLALLHDTIDSKYFNEDPVSIILRLTNGLKFRHTVFDIEKCNIFVSIINSARWSNRNSVSTESHLVSPHWKNILSDADWLDAIGNIGIFRTIAYNSQHWKPNGPCDTPMRAVLRHYHEKLKLIPKELHTDKAREAAVELEAQMTQYFTVLEKQLQQGVL